MEGPKGGTGLQGEKGEVGSAGVQGLQGETGPVGPKGETGPQGIQGNDGIQGIQGPKGDKGDTGNTGLTGPQGLQGIKGDKGDIGPQGPIGPAGTFTGSYDSSSGLQLTPYGTSAGNTTAIRFYDLVGNNIKFVGFKAPDAVANSLVWTLPSSDGSNGQCTSTNGSGILSFKDCLSTAVTNINGLNGNNQTFATGTAGTDFNISSSGTTHTFNIPNASSTSRGLVTTGNQTIAGQKTLTNPLLLGAIIQQDYSVTTDAKQLMIQGNTNSNQQLELGYNTTGDYATIQAVKQSVDWRNLILNPVGGNIGIFNTNPQTRLHIGSSTIGDGINLLRLEDTNSVCNFNANSGTPSCGSDLTLKKDVNTLDLTDLLKRINNLRPVSYHWKTDDSSLPLQSGFIAQEVEQQFPDLVKEDLWIDGSKKKFLNTNGLIPYIIGAMKAQQLQIEDLQKQIDELKNSANK